MANKVFVLLSSGDREVALEVGLRWPLNAAKKKWVDEVKVIIFGPSERVAAYDLEVKEKLRELQEAGIEVIACKACADEYGVTRVLEEADITVIYVGSLMAELINDGWASLTF